jgi:hypothetical protein
MSEDVKEVYGDSSIPMDKDYQEKLGDVVGTVESVPANVKVDWHIGYVSSMESKLTVSTTVPKVMAGVGMEDKDEEKTIGIHKFVTTPAVVDVTFGSKKMFEKYEPLEVRVSVSYPCYKEEIADAYDYVSGFVASVVKEEFDEIRNEFDKRKRKEKGVVDEGEGATEGKGWY